MAKKYNQGVADANRRRTKHGGASATPSAMRKLYRIWHGIRQRCGNPEHTHYHRYGGRGVTVASEWETSFERFVADVGLPTEAGMTLDRVDNNGNYESGNVRWATRKEQANNRSTNVLVSHEGMTLTLMQWATHLGWPYSLLSSRWKAGKRGAELFEATRVAKYKTKVEYGGKSMTLREWSNESGVPYETLWWRHKHGKALL